MGKARPRMCRVNGRSLTYTPVQTTEYERLVRTSYGAVSNFRFEKNVPLEISMLALFPIPESMSKKMKFAMVNGEVLPTKKPDCDNIIKIVLDALNDVAYRDDAQVCKVHFAKNYAENPGVKVKIKELVL